MKQYLSAGKEPNFQKIIITSAVLHLLFITLATMPLKTRDREYKSYYVNLVSPAALRSAAKEGPKTTGAGKSKTEKKDTLPAKPVLQKRTRAEPKADMSLEPAERVKREIERLRAIRDLSREKQKEEEQLARANESDEKLAQAIEVIRKGKLEGAMAGKGIPGAQTSMDSDSYYALVTQQIWSEWIFPDFDASGLETVISIKIGKDGTVISQEIEKSSGNLLFDRSAAKAISKASPLPPPPVEMEIGVRFYL